MKLPPQARPGSAGINLWRYIPVYHYVSGVCCILGIAWISFGVSFWKRFSKSTSMHIRREHMSKHRSSWNQEELKPACQPIHKEKAQGVLPGSHEYVQYAILWCNPETSCANTRKHTGVDTQLWNSHRKPHQVRRKPSQIRRSRAESDDDVPMQLSAALLKGFKSQGSRELHPSMHLHIRLLLQSFYPSFFQFACRNCIGWDRLLHLATQINSGQSDHKNLALHVTEKSPKKELLMIAFDWFANDS